MGSWRWERTLPEDGLPGLLRELARALDTGGADTAGGRLEGLPACGLRKLVLTAECRADGLAVRLKAKPARHGHGPGHGSGHHGGHDAAAARPEERPGGRAEARSRQDQDRPRSEAVRDKYRELKKALQADFKALMRTADQGRLPAAEDLESFLGLAEAMGQVSQPVGVAALGEIGQGNAAFLEACQDLRRAYAAGDVRALGEVLQRLARRKSACHAQFREG